MIDKSKTLIYAATVVVTWVILFSLLSSVILSRSPAVGDSSLSNFDSLKEIEHFVNSRIVSRNVFYITELEETAVRSGPEPQSKDYSTTNVQVEGIDEQDIVKTDGSFLYLVNMSHLLILKAYPIDEISLVSVLSFDNYYLNGLYLDKRNDVIVISANKYMELRDEVKTVEKRMANPVIGRVYEPVVSIFVIDVNNPHEPVIRMNVTFLGFIANTRLYNSILYLSVNQDVYDYSSDFISDKPKVKLPIFWINGDKLEVNPSNISYIPDLRDLSFLYNIMMALDLSTLNYYYTVVLMGSSSTFYMSYDNIYLVQPVYKAFIIGIPERIYPMDDVSRIYRFSIDGIIIRFTAYGEVNGYINSQFQLDEYKGFLRVSTYTWGDWRNESSRYTNIFVLDMDLNVIGSITGIASSEVLYATRFMGDYAYLVTFRLIDPFFVVNLKDPRNPFIEGELKIPGFSTLLQPVGDSLLVGLGYEVDNQSRIEGIKLSLFDVSEPSNPKEIDKIVFNMGIWSWSEALYNHKAMLTYPKLNLIGFSIISVGENQLLKQELTTRYLVVSIENAYSLKVIANLDISDISRQTGSESGIRGVIISEYLYVLNGNGLQVYGLDGFSLLISIKY